MTLYSTKNGIIIVHKLFFMCVYILLKTTHIRIEKNTKLFRNWDRSVGRGVRLQAFLGRLKAPLTISRVNADRGPCRVQRPPREREHGRHTDLQIRCGGAPGSGAPQGAGQNPSVYRGAILPDRCRRNGAAKAGRRPAGQETFAAAATQETRLRRAYFSWLTAFGSGPQVMVFNSASASA